MNNRPSIEELKTRPGNTADSKLIEAICKEFGVPTPFRNVYLPMEELVKHVQDELDFAGEELSTTGYTCTDDICTSCQ
jgi:hypothetical protein